jgi:hypothetical protein
MFELFNEDGLIIGGTLADNDRTWEQLRKYAPGGEVKERVEGGS